MEDLLNRINSIYVTIVLEENVDVKNAKARLRKTLVVLSLIHI